MIFSLDEMGDTALATSVMEFAEPPAGMATQYIKTQHSLSPCACMFMSNLVGVILHILVHYMEYPKVILVNIP